MNALTLDVEQLTDIPQAQFLLATQMRKNVQFAKLAQQALQDFEIFDWLERQQIEPVFRFDEQLISVGFTGDGPKLAELWTILRRSGWNTTSRPKKGDTSYYGWWSKNDQCATISLSFTSSVCPAPYEPPTSGSGPSDDDIPF